MTPSLQKTLVLAALGLLLLGCFVIILPFLSALLWSAVLAFSTWPVFERVVRFTRGRRTLAAVLMTLLIAVVLLLPFALVGASLADNVASLAAATERWIADGPPQPPEWVSGIPLVGQPLSNYWQGLVDDTGKFRQELAGLVKPASRWALGVGVQLGQGVLELGLSVLVAFFLFRDGRAAAEWLRQAAGRLAGARGMSLLDVARKTMRAVVYGVLGTALVQAAVAGTGFLIAGVPGPLFLALLTFFLSAILPFGPPFVWVPASIWLFHQGEVGWGVFMLLWGLGVSSVDNVVRPVLISHGTDLPFILVFLGVLGGILAFGFIGVFLGPTLLAVGYRLLVGWVASAVPAEAAESEEG